MSKTISTASAETTTVSLSDAVKQSIIAYVVVVIDGIQIRAEQEEAGVFWNTSFLHIETNTESSFLVNDEYGILSATIPLSATELGSVIALAIGYGNPTSTDYNVEQQFADDIPSVIYNSKELWRPNF